MWTETDSRLKNSPQLKHLFCGHEATEIGPGVPFIAAICFSQHTVIALCSSIDFVLNPGLSQILTASTFSSPLHLLRLAFPPILHILHVQSSHIDRYTLWLRKACFFYIFCSVFSHGSLQNISGQWLMNNSQQLGRLCQSADGISLREFTKQPEKVSSAD